MSNQSDDIKQLAEALNKAQAKLRAAAKDGENPHFRSSYASLQSVWNAAREALTPHGLSVAQTFEKCETGDVMHIVTTLMHTSGQWIRGTLSIHPSKADPQGIGSAITYGRRYALSAILGIVADDDDDGNEASKPQPYKMNGPMITEATSKALSAACGDAKAADKMTRALKQKGVESYNQLSEDDAKKLLKWATT